MPKISPEYALISLQHGAGFSVHHLKNKAISAFNDISEVVGPLLIPLSMLAVQMAGKKLNSSDFQAATGNRIKHSLSESNKMLDSVKRAKYF